ncbi:MAG TPA: hypothetical protein VK564_00560 [Thermodesulfobacteriota bacterium]|nr:hypothetical protein [Thermodesulfobacteriota bacterium]
MDTFATPFVQGRLRQEPVRIRVETVCAHCGEPMHFEVDQEMSCSCPEGEPSPIIFVPEVDLSRLKQPHIIEAF